MKRFQVTIIAEETDVDTVTLQDVQQAYASAGVAKGSVVVQRRGITTIIKKLHIEELADPDAGSIQDSERLNWLESNPDCIDTWLADDPNGNPTRRLWLLDGVCLAGARPTLREAIDAAINTCGGLTP